MYIAILLLGMVIGTVLTLVVLRYQRKRLQAQHNAKVIQLFKRTRSHPPTVRLVEKPTFYDQDHG